MKELQAKLSSWLSTEKEITNGLTFLFSVMLAFASSSLIRLTAPNPYNISNVANATTHWNPENNYLRVIYLIVASVAIYGLLTLVRNRLGQRWFRVAIALTATLAVFLGTMVTPFINSGVDMFHNGEQLSPSLAFHNGKGLYSDLYFLHGTGEDIGVANLGFNVLHHGVPSIGAYALMTVLLKTVSVLAFFLLLGWLLRTNALFLFATAWFVGSTFSGFEYIKNIFIYAFLALAWLLLTRILRLRWQLATAASLGFVASIALIYSVDVGVIMTGMAVLLAIALAFVAPAKPFGYELRLPKRIWENFYNSLAIIGGILVAQLLILIGLGGSQYHEFLRISFIEIPRYQGLMFDYPATGFTDANYFFFLPIIIASVIGFGILSLIIHHYKAYRRIDRDVAFALVLYGLAVLYIRFGVGRPDAPHIISASCLTFVSGFYTLQLYLAYASVKLPRPRRAITYRPAIWVPVVFLLLLFWPQTTFKPTQLFASSNTTPRDVKALLRLPNKPDKDWLNLEQQKVTRFIDSHTTRKDSIFVFEPEPLYYYLTNRNNPSRFYITWFADPQQYTNELLADLKKDPPKYIIYDGPSPYVIADGVSIGDRVPEVRSWILNNYKHKTVIDTTTILSRD